MMHLELSVSDATIWSVTLESSNTTQEASSTLTYDVYSTGVTYDEYKIDNCNLFIVQARGWIFTKHFMKNLKLINIVMECLKSKKLALSMLINFKYSLKDHLKNILGRFCKCHHSECS
jgi:hypothetical protein